MARNLRYQFFYAINNNFKEGMDKHSDKANGIKNTGKIYSYSDRKNLVEFSSNFANHMKVNHPEIKMIKDIKPVHIQGFMNEKSKTCSNATMQQYKSKFNKLEKIVNNTYNLKINYSRGYSVPISREATKIRNTQMNREHYNMLKTYFQDSRSSAATAIQLSEKLGLRVSECCKIRPCNIDITNSKVQIIDSKGGRDREVEIREQDKQYFIELKEMYADENDRICPVKEDSINKALSRAMESLGIKSEYSDTGIHCIRKMYAQELYDSIREVQKEEGYDDINKALGQVSQALGHSDNRLELMKVYVLNIH